MKNVTDEAWFTWIRCSPAQKKSPSFCCTAWLRHQQWGPGPARGKYLFKFNGHHVLAQTPGKLSRDGSIPNFKSCLLVDKPSKFHLRRTYTAVSRFWSSFISVLRRVSCKFRSRRTFTTTPRFCLTFITILCKDLLWIDFYQIYLVTSALDVGETYWIELRYYTVVLFYSLIYFPTQLLFFLFFVVVFMGLKHMPTMELRLVLEFHSLFSRTYIHDGIKQQSKQTVYNLFWTAICSSLRETQEPAMENIYCASVNQVYKNTSKMTLNIPFYLTARRGNAFEAKWLETTLRVQPIDDSTRITHEPSVLELMKEIDSVGIISKH